jgi:hypothetical protein
MKINVEGKGGIVSEKVEKEVKEERSEEKKDVENWTKIHEEK